MITKDVLRKFEMFSGLTDTELGKIAELGEREVLKAGTVIFKEGSEATRLYMLEEGKVAIYIEIGHGRAVTVSTVHAGQTFAWSALVPPYEFTASGKCLQESRVLTFPGEALRQLCDANPRLGLKLLRNITQVCSQRLSDTHLQLIEETQS